MTRRCAHTPLPSSLLTLDQVAADLVISRGTLERLIERGRKRDPSGIRSIRLAPQVIRVPRSEIEAFICRRLSGEAAEVQP